MVWAILFALGILVGFAVGRWWAFVAPIALGIYIASESEGELPPGLLALIHTVIAGAGVAAGIAFRRLPFRRLPP